MPSGQDFNAIEPKPDPIRVAIAAVVRHDADGGPEVLAAWRSESAVRGGVWEFPGGKVEVDETPADAARRETLEELGIDIEIIRPIGVAEDFDPSQPREHHVVVELMLARARGVDPTAEDRIWRWIPLAELDRHAWPRANAALITELQREIAPPPAG
jgi:8-oxo-dGTP diphosphatase